VIHDDKLTGWTFETPTDSSGKPPAGGLIMRQMRHQGHNFARDIRMIGLWIEVEHVDDSGIVTTTDNPVLRILDPAFGFTPSVIQKLEPTPIVNHPGWKEKFEWLKDFDDALNFSDYVQDPQGTYSGYGVKVTYDAPDLMSKLGHDDCEHSGLSIDQVSLFSRYSDQPPHEPFGLVAAARCHPLVRYEFKKNTAVDTSKAHSRIASIRFDFRLHLYLDSDYQTTNAPQNRTGTKNQAGLFTDHDSPGVHLRITTFSFSMAEKPVVLEVSAPGLVMGYHSSGGLALGKLDPLYDIDCWDNLHWWGLRATKDTYISAPGAFHAGHMHWRWGNVLGLASGELAPYTASLVDTGQHFNPGTPLVDPAIPLQTLRLAVTQNKGRFTLDKNRLVDLTAMDWESLFETNNSPPPQYIEDGDDIVLWYSTRVHTRLHTRLLGNLPLPSALSGTVFLHGLFFPHDPEVDAITVGSTSAEHINRSESEIIKAKKWIRPWR
jgi:hypothetical protein